MNKPVFNKVAIIGLGLIGASFALALRKAGMAKQITGSARSESTCRLACELGVVDAAFENPLEAVKDADFVF